MNSATYSDAPLLWHMCSFVRLVSILGGHIRFQKLPGMGSLSAHGHTLDLQVLCKTASPRSQLQKEEVWPHKPAAAQEEDRKLLCSCAHVTGSGCRAVLTTCCACAAEVEPLAANMAF